MAAYIVFIKESVIDQAEMDIYAPLAGVSTAGHPITPLVFYNRCETLEGPAAQGVVLVQFPDMAAARAWYDSPAYQEAKAHRLKGGVYRVIMTEGVG